MNKSTPQTTGAIPRERYTAPQLKRWGTVADLTKVGNTRSINDNWRGNAPHAPGSINPPGHRG